MIKRIFKFFIAFLSLGLLVVLGSILIPRNYNIPKPEKRANIKYWTLNDNSRIAYTHLIPDSNLKSFPIIYLHGGPGGPISNHHIKSLQPLTNSGYEIYLYDQIGCGYSDRLDDISQYTTDRHVKDLEEIIAQIGASKVILIGHSWGGMLMNLFLEKNESKVSRAIFSSPGPVLPINHKLAGITAPDSLNIQSPYYTNQSGSALASNIRSMAMQKCARLWNFKLAADEEADAFATYQNGFLNRSTVMDTSLQVSAVFGSGFYTQVMTVKSFYHVPDHRHTLAQIKIPVLILKGQYDNQKWGFTNEYTQLYRNHQFIIIPKAGHSISREQPDLYTQYIIDFLEQKTKTDVKI